MNELKNLEENIEAGSASIDDREARIKLFQDIAISSGLLPSDQDLLEVLVSLDEIKITDLSKLDINEFVSNFLETNRMPLDSNSSFITLIPKASNPIQFKDLWPISLIVTDYPHDMDNIIRVLHIFYLAYGLKINVHKYNVYGIGVSTKDVNHLAANTSCSAGSFPFVYLGLPIGSNMNLTVNWKLLIDNFYTKLSTWKVNLLSYEGRLTLIKVVLGSLGIYYLSIFKAPEFVLKMLERIRASFFWSELGVRNSAYLRDMLLEINQVDIAFDGDVCIWSLANDDVFSDGSTRRLIDDRFLPSLDTPSIWDKTLPTKHSLPIPVSWRGNHTRNVVAAMAGVQCCFDIRSPEPHLPSVLAVGIPVRRRARHPPRVEGIDAEGSSSGHGRGEGDMNSKYVFLKLNQIQSIADSTLQVASVKAMVVGHAPQTT
ncbi:hypothetical protein Tco_1132751 [Tanacetum coccineum]|uniref:Uncharacterized protein n=1 Tax=Tanacetum coccineum TaxID=301880 RepID=A0ABQ5JEJ4_9ASTR